jgi:hypothetical protein
MRASQGVEGRPGALVNTRISLPMMLGRWEVPQKDLVTSSVCRPKRRNGHESLADDRGGPKKTRSALLGL